MYLPEHERAIVYRTKTPPASDTDLLQFTACDTDIPEVDTANYYHK